MKLAFKAALLSSLIYPGAGHFLLKRYVTCLVLACMFSVPLLVILNEVISIAQMLVTQIATGDVPLDVIKIRHQLLKHIEDQITDTSYNILIVLAFIWGASIVDAYRIGVAISKHP